ncbi:MAG: endo alpha-1,4 polygalactosaminidase [Aquificae bacterium]|nr:endo alpha-1,4 polygalactosaminidase [Aquificota bacterium]
MLRLLFVLAFTVVVSGCVGGGGSDGGDYGVESPLTVESTWYWQLYVDEKHPLRMDIPAQVYDIDLFDTPVDVIKQLKEDGKVVICYFSAGSYEEWRPDSGLFPEEALGNPLEGWEGERWLDIRNPAVRTIMAARLDLAKEKGCDGVEPDNVDGYTNNTGFPLTYSDQIDYNLFLSQEAHRRGLLVGLKNDLLQVEDLVDYFDFAVNEQCHQYGECYYLDPFIKQGKPVFNAEYWEVYITDDEAFRKLCEDAKSRNFRTLVLPVNLDGSFVKSCDYGEY